MLAAGELVNRLRKARIQATEGPNAGGLYLPPLIWRAGFTAEELRAIDAIGPTRILDADPKQAGIVLSQLAKALEEV